MDHLHLQNHGSSAEWETNTGQEEVSIESLYVEIC